MPNPFIQKFRSISLRKLLGLVSWKHIGRFAVVVLVIAVASTQTTYAIDNPFNITAIVTDSLANFFYSLQTIASWLIYLAGSLLNFSINLTMHIKEFVTATPAIYTVWKAIRDISGMFIIFALLYSAIRMIIGLGAKGDLIKNIVVAGVLINFSFFITGLAIDVSNVVSIQLYNAIAPAQNLNIAADAKTGVLGSYLDSSSKDGGLSTIFMQSLGVTRLYNPSGGLTATGKAVANTPGSSGWTAPLKIIIISVTSIIIMITAALSFFLAALAFIVRFVILLFLLAFSPILFASYVVPEIDKYATQWKDTLKSQLIFMPVYLLLMYFALSVLTSSSIFKNGFAGALTSSGGFLGDLMVLAVNAVLVIIMLNFPLVAAMSVMGKVPKWAEGFKAENIWKKVGGSAGRNTLGAAANVANNHRWMRALYAAEPNLGIAVSKGLSKVSGASFGDKKGGYDAALKARKKDVEALYKHVGTDDDKERGQKYQETMRQNLDKRSVFTLMMRDRANVETAGKYNKKAEKDAAITLSETQAREASTKERQIQAEIEVVTKSIDLLKDSARKSAGELQRRKTDQIADINKQVGELRGKATEYREKSAKVMPSMAGDYKKNADEFERRAQELENAKASITAAPAPTTSQDIEMYEKHLSSLRRAKEEARNQREDASEKAKKERREKEREEDREKLAGSLKDSLGGSGGGDKDKGGGDKDKSKT